MKQTFVLLAALLVFLQYKLWFAEGGYNDVRRLKASLEEVKQKNKALALRNKKMFEHIKALKKNDKEMEALARAQLGMVKKNETYYQIVEQ